MPGAQRITHKVTIPTDADPESEETLTFEVIDEIVFETGEGSSYQKRHIVFKNEDDQGEQTAEGRVTETKTVEFPNGNKVEVTIVRSLKIETGEGSSYQARIVSFENWDESKRIVHVKEIDLGDDESLKAEIIDRFSVETGEGSSYQQSQHILENTEEEDSSSGGGGEG